MRRRAATSARCTSRNASTRRPSTQFRQALVDHPRSALAHYNLAILFAETKIYREARAEWAAAAKADPQGDIGRRSLANVKIVEQMMSAQAPGAPGQPPPARP